MVWWSEDLVDEGGTRERAGLPSTTSVYVLQRAADGLRFLGVSLDVDRNNEGKGDRQIGSDGTAVHTLVVAAREDLEMARQVRAVVAGQV